MNCVKSQELPRTCEGVDSRGEGMYIVQRERERETPLPVQQLRGLDDHRTNTSKGGREDKRI